MHQGDQAAEERVRSPVHCQAARASVQDQVSFNDMLDGFYEELDFSILFYLRHTLISVPISTIIENIFI